MSATLPSTSNATTSSYSRFSALVRYHPAGAWQSITYTVLGTFAKVWLAKLAKPGNGDGETVFALKVLKKMDGERALRITDLGLG